MYGGKRSSVWKQDVEHRGHTMLSCVDLWILEAEELCVGGEGPSSNGESQRDIGSVMETLRA